MRRFRAVTIAFAAVLAFAAAAQPAACPALVSEALIAVGNACGGLARNEACYGNLRLRATPRDESVTLQFEQAGDREPVVDFAALQLAPLSAEASEWGIALMALQANLPESLPGQNATIVLFGDVEIENRGTQAGPLADVFATGNNVNVRQTPSTSAAVVERLGAVPQRVVGRLGDGTWLRVMLDDGRDGWVSASVVTVQGDVSLLTALTPADPAPQLGGYGPMQAFRLKTGIGAPACSEAPLSGILIQTPEGAHEIVFEINKVTVTLGSTALARTTETALRIALIEGQAAVTIAGNSGTIRAGRVGVFQLDANGDATGEFTVEPYTEADIAALPLPLLPVTVVAAPVLAPGDPQVVPEGTWLVQSTLRERTAACATSVGVSEEIDPVEIVQRNDGTITLDDELVLSYDGDVWRGTVEIDVGALYETEFSFSGNTATGTGVITNDGCRLVVDHVLTYVNED